MLTIKKTTEWTRISNLPRRIPTAHNARIYADVLTRYLSSNPGAPTMQLLPWQGHALWELMEVGGLVWFASVGTGKTLFSYLACVLSEAERPMVIVPTSLAEKTRDEFAEFYDHWRPPKGFIIIRTYHDLQSNPSLLEDDAPTLCLLDECDEIANYEASRATRVLRYAEKHSVNLAPDGDCIFAGFTATPVRFNPIAYWTIMTAALGNRSCLPQGLSEMKLWDALLCTDRARSRPGFAPRPGPFGRTRKEAIEWYSRRLRETPGVLITDEESCDTPIHMGQRRARECRFIDEACETILTRYQNPAGVPFEDPLTRDRLLMQAGCGYYQYWDPPPPNEWRIARRECAKFTRDMIRRSQYTAEPLDTALQVIRRYADHPIVTEWARIKPTYDEKRHTRIEWISDETILSVADWLAEIREPGIIWVGSRVFGPRCAERLGLRYYGAKGKSKDGVGLHHAPPNESLVVSWNANKKGFNLQPWNRNLIVYPPSSAKWIEQLAGRTHRKDQTRSVSVEWLITCGVVERAFDAAVTEACGVSKRESLNNKILRARITHAPSARINRTNEYRWFTQEEY